MRRIDKLAEGGHVGAQALATYFVGQGVGLMNKVKSAREVVLEFIEDYVAAAERLGSSLGIRRDPLAALTSPRLGGHSGHRFCRSGACDWRKPRD